MAPCKPPAEVVIDSKTGTPRSSKSTKAFLVRKEDFNGEKLRLLIKAPGYARTARILDINHVFQGSGTLNIGVTELFREHILVKFECYPPDATMSIEEISGEGMKPQYHGKFPQIDVATRYDLARGRFLPVPLRISRPGYYDWRQAHKLNALAEPGQEVVRIGPIALQAKTDWASRWEQFKVFHRYKTPQALLVDAVVLAVLLSFPLLLLPNYMKFRKEREHWRRKQALEAMVTGTDPLLKKSLGEYFLVARIGRGGMSKVYRALPQSTLMPEDAVAVKVIDEDLAASAEFRARFRREIEVCASLSHPNIVRLLDWGEQGPALFMVSELVDGETLKEVVTEPLSQARFLQIFGPLIQALKSAHDMGVIHRDLKPANVMLTVTDQVKLMDFGLAKADTTGHNLTKTGDAFGTPVYMSPEQISGGAVDTRSDIYSLGVMAFELLTGRIPFQVGEDPMSVMLAHLQVEPFEIKDFRDDLSPALNDVVNKMLAKDPGERYKDLSEVLEVLQSL